jgi:hypothetical protein
MRKILRIGIIVLLIFVVLVLLFMPLETIFV